jgi:hypothetical protein
MLTNNSPEQTSPPDPSTLPTPGKKRKIQNIDLFRDNNDDDNTTVVIFIAFIFSYLLFYLLY